MLKNKLKLARVAQGDLTQQELAEKVSCSRQTIHSIEACKFVPSIELALRLSRALKTPVEELFMLEDKK
jgi:putative transcriptional regulator